MIFGLQNEREWATFCAKVLERSGDCATDPRFSRTTTPAASIARELTALIEDRFADMTSIEVVKKLDAAGIANGRLNEPQRRLGPRAVQRHATVARGRARRAARCARCCRRSPSPTWRRRWATCRLSASTPTRCCGSSAITAGGDRGAARGGGGMSEFDPAAHRMVPEQRWFEDFQPGRALRAAEPDDDRGGVPGVPGGERRQPSDPLRPSNTAGRAGCRTCWRTGSRP